MNKPSRPAEINIEEWDHTHARFQELMAFVHQQGQSEWVNFVADWHQSSHLLVALRGSALVGFLRFVVQLIGPDTDCPPIRFSGTALREAKVIAFAVQEAQRGQGIGRQLQEVLHQQARDLECYQIRSHSGGKNTANHHLKLSLGYGVHPIIQGEDKSGVYFILPLSRYGPSGTTP